VIASQIDKKISTLQIYNSKLILSNTKHNYARLSQNLDSATMAINVDLPMEEIN
jgi:hypothetical protein